VIYLSALARGYCVVPEPMPVVAQLLILTAANAKIAPGGTMNIDIPALDVPGTVSGAGPSDTLANLDWVKYSANTGTNELMKKLQAAGVAQSQGQDIDLAKQEEFLATLGGISDEIKKESAEVHAEREQQRENEAAILNEGQMLVDAHNVETTQASLYNQAAQVSNVVLLSGRQWQDSLYQANEVESYISTQEDDRGAVVGAGSEVLQAARNQIQELETGCEVEADKLHSKCLDGLFEWNFNAISMINEQTYAIYDMRERQAQMDVQLELAHERVLMLIQTMAEEKAKVKSVGALAEENQGASLLQERAKEVLSPKFAMKPQGLQNGQSLDEIGFWKKLKLMKDMFEERFGELDTPMDLIAQKLHDA